MTFVDAPTCFLTSASDPTNTILPPVDASACASGAVSSTVTMRPFCNTRSAGVARAELPEQALPAAATKDRATKDRMMPNPFILVSDKTRERFGIGQVPGTTAQLGALSIEQ